MTPYSHFAARLTKEAFIAEPWVDGQPRFSETPCLLPRHTYAAMAAAAEAVTAVLNELCQIVAREPQLLDDFFCLTPIQRALFEMSAPIWHGHARADVFLRSGQSPVVCEVNCDTPSGQPEAIALNRIALHDAGGPNGHVVDPCASLAPRLTALVGNVAKRISRDQTEPVAIGIVYPTELPEDLALVRMWTGALEARGYVVVLGSPFNLQATPDDGVAMFGQPVNIVIRHYKTDWWGEREPVWHDESPYPDQAPLSTALAVLMRAQLAGRIFVLNPFGSVLPQNKRSYAFLWEQRARFSPASQSAIEEHVPLSVRLEVADRDALHREQDKWVLKSDYGCEGEEVLIGAVMTEASWRQALTAARPQRWIAQQRFNAVADADGCISNHGIFVVAGQAAGVYTRVSPTATDRSALSVPTLVTL